MTSSAKHVGALAAEWFAGRSAPVALLVLAGACSGKGSVNDDVGAVGGTKNNWTTSGAGTTGGTQAMSSSVDTSALGTGATAATGGGAARATGGTSTNGGARSTGGASATGGVTAKATGGTSTNGGVRSTGGTSAGGAAGTPATGGSSAQWSNIRVVDNHLCDRRGKPFALRSIESMFGNGTSNATAFVAGHKALGANGLGPLPNSSVASTNNMDDLLAAAYAAGLVIGLNADHTNQGEQFFQNATLQPIINRYPNVFLQEAVELGTDMTASQWVQAAKDKVDAYVNLYPDKPLKIGSPAGGRSPRVALDHCTEVVDYYYAKGGRGGLIFTCQLYWKAATASWSYQEDNGFPDGLDGILAAVDAMAASPCLFIPGLDNQDDVGYTGWSEIMDHVRASNSTPGMRLGYQWWVYYNSGDSYDNDLTTNASDALSGITTTGRDVKAKLDLDRESIDLGPMNP